MNGFGMYPTPLQASGPLSTGAPGLGAVPPADSTGLPPGGFSGAPASPTAAGASPLATGGPAASSQQPSIAAILAGLFGGAIGPNAASAAQMPLAQQAQLYSGQQTPGLGGGGLAPLCDAPGTYVHDR